MFKNPFSENRAVYEMTWKKYCRAGHVTDDSTAHAHCMLDTYSYSMSYLLPPLQQWMHEHSHSYFIRVCGYCYNRDGKFTAWYDLGLQIKQVVFRP